MPADLTTDSPTATLALGRALGSACRGGELILLSGELGMGKTCLAKGIAAGLGLEPDTITSPTFTLLAVHRGRLPLYHIDLYRLEQPDEIAHLALFEEPLGPGVTLVEWPQQGGTQVPTDALTLQVSAGPTPNSRHWQWQLATDGPTHLQSALTSG